MVGEVVGGFPDCPVGLGALQLVEGVEDEGSFEEAAIVLFVEEVD